ncbi:hypothetical protein D3C87_1740720 [compost metagenome]
MYGEVPYGNIGRENDAAKHNRKPKCAGGECEFPAKQHIREQKQQSQEHAVKCGSNARYRRPFNKHGENTDADDPDNQVNAGI